MKNSRYSRDDAIRLLREKAAELSARGEDRYPRRADFSDEETVAVKAFLGPWPRALEAAGLKPERGDGGRKEKNREKRILAKRRLRLMKKTAGRAVGSEPDGNTKKGADAK